MPCSHFLVIHTFLSLSLVLGTIIEYKLNHIAAHSINHIVIRGDYVTQPLFSSQRYTRTCFLQTISNLIDLSHFGYPDIRGRGEHFCLRKARRRIAAGHRRSR